MIIYHYMVSIAIPYVLMIIYHYVVDITILNILMIIYHYIWSIFLCHLIDRHVRMDEELFCCLLPGERCQKELTVVSDPPLDEMADMTIHCVSFPDNCSLFVIF